MFHKLRVLGANVMTFLVALVPVFKSCPPCPICMPKYAALFALFGLELADYSHYLVPVMLGCMLLTLSSMYLQVNKNQLSMRPFILAAASCILLLFCKYVISVSWIVYLAMFGLFCGLVLHYYNLNVSKAVNCCAAKAKL